MASHSDLGTEAVAAPILDRLGVADADQYRIGVKALFTDGEQVLLIKEGRTDGSTFWTLPGGGVKQQESPVEGLHRELEEELRCDAALDQSVSVCVYEHTTHESLTTLYVVFTGRLLSSPTPNPAEGILDCAWVVPTNMPSSTLTPFQRLLTEF